MNYHKYQSAQPAKIYLAGPGGRMTAPLQGVEKARLTQKFNDIWEMDLEVCRTLTSPEGNRENPAYPLLLPMQELYVEDLGWFRIQKTPSITMDGTREYKAFTAYGIESQLQDLDVIDFYINCGNSLSREFFEENLDPLGIPQRNIRLYIPQASDTPGEQNYRGLGLLNILEEEYLSRKGWSVGEVDLELRDKAGRKFEVESQDLYSFLIHTVAPAYRCVFVFDRIQKQLHIRSLEGIGKTLNLECSFRNLIRSAQITDKEGDIRTCFRVAGGDDHVSISYVNLGSDCIENLGYFTASGVIPEETASKYEIYSRYRESKRGEYTACCRDQFRLLRQISDLEELLPADEVTAEWRAYSLEELKIERDRFQAILTYLEERNTVHGELQIEDSHDYGYYLSIQTVILPDIEAEIKRKEEGSTEEPVRVDYKTNWALYGISELEAFYNSYSNTQALLAEKGYDQPWDPSLSGHSSEEAHQRQYETYLKITGYLKEIQTRLDLLKEKKGVLEKQLDQIQKAQSALVEDTSVNNPLFDFTQEELALLEALRIQSDYTDSSIEAPDLNDADTLLERCEELLQSARDQLEIESRPQLTYQIDLDNPLYLSRFSEKFAQVEQGDFIYLSLDNRTHTKQRCIQMSYELADRSDSSFSISFSDMITAYGKSDDYRFLLNGKVSSSKNSITKSVADYVDSAAANATNALWGQYSGSGLVSGMNSEDLLRLSDMLSGLVGGNLTLDELKVRLAQIDTLEANSAFIQYLNTQYLVANQADFNALSALAANLRQAVIGTSSTETGIVVHLTSENAKIDQLLVRDQIAGQIRVGDLQAGDITLSNQMRILSENGQLVMDGATLQIKGKNAAGEDYVGIQLGYDTSGKPSLIVRDEAGAAVLTSQGITRDAVADDLIQNRMLDSGSVSHRNIDWTGISEGVDSEGRPVWDVGNIVIGGKEFGAEYTSFTQSTAQEFSTVQDQFAQSASQISGVSSKISAVEKSITDKVWQTDIENKIDAYDGSQIKTIRDRITVTETDIEGIGAQIKEVQTSLSSKADGSAVTELTDKTNQLQTSVDGTKTELTSLKTIVEAKADGSAVTALESWKNITQTTVEGFQTKIENLNTTTYGNKDGSESAAGLNKRTLELEASVSGVRSRLEDTYTKGEIDQNLESLVEQSVSSFKTEVKAEVKSKVTPYYALSTSDAQPPQDGWSAVMPAKAAGQYLWRKDLLIYGDGTSEWLTPYVASGSDGAPGPKGDNGQNAVSVILSNESHTFAAGSQAASPGSAVTEVIGFYGSERTAVTVGPISSLPEGMSVSIQENSTVRAKIIFTVTTLLTSPSGVIQIPCTLKGVTLNKEFSYSLSFAGDTGADARTYELSASALALKKGADNSLTPSQLHYSAYYRDGSALTRSPYVGRFRIEESKDGNSWTIRYTSTADEFQTTYTPSTGDIQLIRCTLLASGANGQPLDQQSTVILTYISNLEIGGRNLLLNSSFADNTEGWTRYGTGHRQAVKYDKKCWHLTGSIGTEISVGQSILPRMEANTTYTLSGWTLTENITRGTTNFVAALYLSGYYNNNGTSTWFGYGAKSFTINTGAGKWEHLSYTFTTDEKIETATSLSAYVLSRDYTGDVYFYNVKLEKANKASDWSPAPEDQEAALNQAVTTLNTQINQTAEKIQLEAEKTFTTKGELGLHTQELRSAIEANSDSIRSTVSRQDYDRDFETGGSKITSILNQTESSYQMYFSGKQQEILGAAREEAKAVADQKLEDYGTYFEFSQDGMLIGKKGTEGNFKARFDNEQLAFLEGDNVVTWISNRTFHALGMETEGAMNMTNAKVPGKWVTEADATGRLNIYWRE